jgi:hypothetical protein
MFEAYSDESGFPAERYHAISVVSGQREHIKCLRSYLDSVLWDRGLSELKFEEVRGHRPKLEAAREFIRHAVEFAADKKVRVDVLIWDTQDSRHSVVTRDDIANLHRMYYKVLVHIGRTWGQTDWSFYPDERSDVDWGEIQGFLNKTGTVKTKPQLLKLFDEQKKFFRFVHITPRKSDNEPLVQLADLFAGIATFSRQKGEGYQSWIRARKHEQHPALFEVEGGSVVDSSKADIVRFELLQGFEALCKDHNLGVNLSKKCYLWTPNPKNSINFWNYEPQHEDDKAPTRLTRARRGGVRRAGTDGGRARGGVRGGR